MQITINKKTGVSINEGMIGLFFEVLIMRQMVVCTQR